MDPEKQPLLGQGRSELRCRFRALSTDEVLVLRQEATWRRTRFCLIFIFWCLMAMFLSIIACLLISAPKCSTVDRGIISSVPPVHLSFAPLMYKVMNTDG